MTTMDVRMTDADYSVIREALYAARRTAQDAMRSADDAHEHGTAYDTLAGIVSALRALNGAVLA